MLIQGQILNLCHNLLPEWNDFFSSNNLNLVSREKYDEGEKNIDIGVIIYGDNMTDDELDNFKIVEKKIKTIYIGVHPDKIKFIKYNGILSADESWIKEAYAKTYLNLILNDSGSLHLSETFSEIKSDTASLKIEARKDIGFYGDQIGNTAFSLEFDLVKIRTFSLFALSYLSYTEDSNLTSFPIEVEMAKIGHNFCVQFLCPTDKNFFYQNYLEQSFYAQGESPLKIILLEMIKYSDFLCIGQINDGKKFLLSAFWGQEKSSLKKESFLIYNIKSFSEISAPKREDEQGEVLLIQDMDEGNRDKKLFEKIDLNSGHSSDKNTEKESNVEDQNETTTARGSYLDTLDDDFIVSTEKKEEKEDNGTVKISGGTDKIHEKMRGEISAKQSFLKEKEKKTETSSSEDNLFETKKDIEMEKEDWEKIKNEVINENKDELIQAKSSLEVDTIIKKAITEKISITPAEFDKLVEKIKEAINNGEIYSPERTEEKQEGSDFRLDRLKRDLEKKNEKIIEQERLIDKFKLELKSYISLEHFEKEKSPLNPTDEDTLKQYRVQIKNLFKEVSQQEKELSILKNTGTRDSPVNNLESVSVDKEGEESTLELREKLKHLEGLNEIGRTRLKNMNNNIEVLKKELQKVENYKKNMNKKEGELSVLKEEIKNLKAMGQGASKATKVTSSNTPDNLNKKTNEHSTIKRLASQLNDIQIDLKTKNKKLKELEQKNKFLNGQLLSAASESRKKGTSSKSEKNNEQALQQKITKISARAQELEVLARRFKEGFEVKKRENTIIIAENKALKIQLQGSQASGNSEKKKVA